MGKTFATICLVCALIFSNFLISHLHSPPDNPTENSTETLSDNDVLDNDNKLEDMNEEMIIDSESNGDIDWDLLPENSNPSAKLFVNQSAVAIDYRLPLLSLETTEEGEFFTGEGITPLLEPGKPMVPELKLFVAVPEGSEVLGVEIVEGESRQLDGYHTLAPYLPKTVEGETLGYSPDLEVYGGTEPFPSILYQVNGPDKLRHLNALEVILYPVSYRPVMGIIEVYDHLRIRVDLDLKDSKHPSIPKDDELDCAFLDLIANYQDVVFSSEAMNSHGTRAPSTIYHTLGYHGDVGTIHPVKDNTTGNAGGAALLHEDDGAYYDAEAGKTLYLDGFDVGSANPGASLVYAVLHVQFFGTGNYSGDSKVRWGLEGQPLSNTTIQPEDLNDTESADLSFYLLGHPGSPSIVSDIAELDIEFSENGIGEGSKDIPFDYIWVEFAYREEMSGDSDYLIITDLAFADELRSLAEWKTERLNIYTQVFDTDWIDDNCDGGNLLSRIYDFVKSMFENYSIEYVLLGGDENFVPTDNSNSIYDSFYADVVGYAYPDLATGRLCTDSDYEMEGMVEDILAYQRDMRPLEEERVSYRDKRVQHRRREKRHGICQGLLSFGL